MSYPSVDALQRTLADTVFKYATDKKKAAVHEQSIVGEEVVLWVEGLPGEIPIGGKKLTANHTEPFRKINFFGIEIPFGPLIHTWTDMELVEARPLNDNRTEFTFKGGAKSNWKIEYKRSDERKH